MKKIYIPIISIFAIIAICLVGFMVDVMTDGPISHSWSFENFSFGGELKVVSDETYKSDGIENIDVEFSSDGVKVFLNDKDEIRVIEYMSKDPKEGELAITDIDSDTFRLYRNYNHIGINMNMRRVEVYLPKSYTKNLSAQTASGSIKLEDDFTLVNCTLETSSGSIKTNDVSAKEVNFSSTSGSIRSEKAIDADDAVFEASSGSINLNEVNTEKVKADTNSGSIRIDKVKGEQDFSTSSGSIHISEAEGVQEMSTSSGSINVEGITGGGSYETTSGGIRLNFSDINSNITCNASSGSVRMEIPDDESFNFKGKSSSGSINTFFENNTSSKDKEKTAKVGDNPEFDINVHTNSGSINLD